MSTYTSQHYRGHDPAEIEAWLGRKFGQLRRSGNNWVVQHCCFCHDDKGKSENQWRLAFTLDTGAYRCPRCNSSGSYWDIKKSMGDIPDLTDAWGNTHTKKPRNYARPDQTIVSSYPSGLQYNSEVLYYLANERKLKPETLKHYGVGSALYSFQEDVPDAAHPGQFIQQWQEHVCMTFPWIEYQPGKSGEPPQKVIVRVKARAIDQKKFMRLDPTGGQWGLFGWHTIPDDAQEIVITEGEFDAMSVWQETGMYAVSLPNGANSFPLELLPYLERFQKIIWWLDDDVPGIEGLNQFSQKVGRHRSWRVETRQGVHDGPKDANEALTRGVSLKTLLDTARPIPHEQILTWEDLKGDVLRELINPGATAGLQYQSLPSMNKILKGHRRGEMTLVTGISGIGKTTVLSQMSLDLAERGASTLWGSFEIKNVRLAKKMIKQYAGKNLENHLDQFENYSKQFGMLPLYFMRFFGSTNIDEVLEASRYCVYAHDVSHVVLDNLQFMTSRLAKGLKKFDVQDEAIDKIRAFCTDENVHITLVIHPKKVKEGFDLDTGDLGGTAKAEQEADNVIMLQRGREFKFLEVKKNRFDGDLGDIPYQYEKETNRIRELTEQELVGYEHTRKSGGSYGKQSMQDKYKSGAGKRSGVIIPVKSNE